MGRDSLEKVSKKGKIFKQFMDKEKVTIEKKEVKFEDAKRIRTTGQEFRNQ